MFTYNPFLLFEGKHANSITAKETQYPFTESSTTPTRHANPSTGSQLPPCGVLSQLLAPPPGPLCPPASSQDILCFCKVVKVLKSDYVAWQFQTCFLGGAREAVAWF